MSLRFADIDILRSYSAPNDNSTSSTAVSVPLKPIQIMILQSFVRFVIQEHHNLGVDRVPYEHWLTISKAQFDMFRICPTKTIISMPDRRLHIAPRLAIVQDMTVDSTATSDEILSSKGEEREQSIFDNTISESKEGGHDTCNNIATGSHINDYTLGLLINDILSTSNTSTEQNDISNVISTVPQRHHSQSDSVNPFCAQESSLNQCTVDPPGQHVDDISTTDFQQEMTVSNIETTNVISFPP